MTAHVSKLWIHPVKGCRGLAVDHAEFDRFGFVGDRRFLITDTAGTFLTQRSHPQMAQITATWAGADLVLSHHLHGQVTVPPPTSTPHLRTVRVWQDHDLLAGDCGTAPAEFLSAALGESVHLVRMGDAFQRPVRRSPVDQVSFADGYPLLVISEGSLELLNQHLVERGEAPVGMERFRPNLVIAGIRPHEEDEWTRFSVAGRWLRGMTRCGRCTVVTADPVTGERSPEPLRTLARYRRDPENPQEVIFGRNVINESKTGRVRIGDPVTMETI